MDLSLAKHEIADKFCDEDQPTNWNIPIDRLGTGENDTIKAATDVNEDLFKDESTEFRENMYRYGKENMIRVNMYIRLVGLIQCGRKW